VLVLKNWMAVQVIADSCAHAQSLASLLIQKL